MINFWYKLRQNPLIHWFVLNLRLLIAFGFIPSGLKKIYSIPFANPGQEGAFFEYLDALYATGFYYEFIGWAQVIAAILLFSQRYALLGAFIFFPIILNIAVFTHSTIGSLTPWIATAMLLGIVFLILWDLPRWVGIISKSKMKQLSPYIDELIVDPRIWARMGVALVVIPLISSLAFRLKPDLANNFILFILLALMLLLVLATNIVHGLRHFRKKK